MDELTLSNRQRLGLDDVTASAILRQARSMTPAQRAAWFDANVNTPEEVRLHLRRLTRLCLFLLDMVLEDVPVVDETGGPTPAP